MDRNTVAQWILDNPQEWHELAMEIAGRNLSYCAQMAQSLDDAHWLHDRWQQEDAADPFLSDGDADANALASVGWGTDEDYGYEGD